MIERIIFKSFIFAALVCLGSYGINKSIDYIDYLHNESHRELTINEEHALKNVEAYGWQCGLNDSGINLNPYSDLFDPKEYNIWRNGYISGQKEFNKRLIENGSSD